MTFQLIVVTQDQAQSELVVESGDLTSHQIRSASKKIFPSGERWEAYENARSFRLVQLDRFHFLLSYTLVLGESHDTWNGRLHAWGLVGTYQDLIGNDGLGMFSPQELFEFQSNRFRMDVFYQGMFEGLAQAPSLNTDIQLTWWKKLMFYSNRLGYQWQYDDPIQWSIVEMFTYQTFCCKMMGPRLRNSSISPVTFSTFSLAKDYTTHITGLPCKKFPRPQISLL